MIALCNGRSNAQSFGDILAYRAAQMPSKRAFVFLGHDCEVQEECTFADLDFAARRIAHRLLAENLAKQRVLLAFPTGLDFVKALFGCFYAGATAVPIPFIPGKRSSERIASIQRDAKPAAMLTLRCLKDDTQLPSDTLLRIDCDRIEGDQEPAMPPPISPRALAMIQYTSGSAASPKGVALDHANLLANSQMICDAFEHDADSRGVGWLPLELHPFSTGQGGIADKA